MEHTLWYSNQTWQWKIDHLLVIFEKETPLLDDFPLPCLIRRMIPRAHVVPRYKVPPLPCQSNLQRLVTGGGGEAAHAFQVPFLEQHLQLRLDRGENNCQM